MRAPQSLLLSRLNNPNSLSLSSQQSCSIPLIPWCPCSGSSSSLSLLCWPRAGCSPAGGSQQSGAEGQNPPSPAALGLWVQPSTGGLCLGAGPALTHSTPKSCQGCSLCSCPAWIGARACPDPGAAPAPGPVQPHEIPPLRCSLCVLNPACCSDTKSAVAVHPPSSAHLALRSFSCVGTILILSLIKLFPCAVQQELLWFT